MDVTYLVPRVDERLQHVGLRGARLASRLNHLIEDGGEIFPRLVVVTRIIDTQVD